MSVFAVTIETIAGLEPIAGADRIEIARLAGMDFQFVVGKGAHTPGEQVVYFPVDALLPDPLIERLGLVGRLSGAARNRVKTVVLRGQISQGVVARLDVLPEGLTANVDPAVLTEALGVSKWEAPDVLTQDAVLRPLPDGQSKYDIESADRFVEIAEALMDQPVFITEKVEGSNFWVRATPDGRVSVGQRGFTIEPKDGVEHSFVALARTHRVGELAAQEAARRGVDVLVYGEALGPGIQGNLYRFPRHTIRFFDLRAGHHWIPAPEFLATIQAFYGDHSLVVPVLQAPDGTTLRQWLAGKGIKEASNGPSRLGSTLREGVVIKPLVESRHSQLGRLVLKQRSPQYLAKTEL